ncbi:MAG TPA: haloacid dehalogenase type II [Thermoleophilaceae bacterium]|nr:haloacid dehalogenase type II [Thermoleophilaceae bacterium]
MPAWKAATFDCYGTLIDWEGGAAAFLYDVARRNGDDDPGPGYLLRRRWEEIQFEHIQQDYRSYNVVLEESLREWVGERGYRWNVNVGYDFARSMQSWQPFPDTIPALTRLREAGVPLAIVSNSESAIMDHTLRQLAPLEFDHVVLADEVRCYKPDRRPFTRMLDKLSAAPEDVLHVAFGFKYDIGRAKDLGMQTAWINRHREPLPDQDTVPDHEWRDLWGLAELAERD